MQESAKYERGGLGDFPFPFEKIPECKKGGEVR